LKKLVKTLFKKLPASWSEQLQGRIWTARSTFFVIVAPVVRKLSNLLGGRFPVAGMPRGVVSAKAAGLSMTAIPGPERTPPIHARTLGELKLEEFADVPLLPASIGLAELFGCHVDGATGAVMDSNHRLVIELSPYGKRSPVERPWDHPVFYRLKQRKSLAIPGTCVLLANPNGGVYFHWLLELLPRLGLLKAQGLLPSDFRCLVSRTSSFVTDSLREAGVPPERVQVIEPGFQYHTERLLTTSDLFPQGMITTLAPWLRETFLGSEASIHRTSPLIYITRRDSGLRTVEDEASLIAIVEELGGQVVTLEGMAVRQQAVLFNTSRCIVAAHGSALANLAFCRPGTRILELYSPGYVRVLYPRIGSALKLDYWYLIGRGKREQPGRPGLYASIRIDPLEFRNTLLKMLGSASETCA
jgi:capsular polysaccharide biosynthesis protein